jgi:2-methylisocitrate lyase-like PEP mutase family enzyme
VTPGARLRELLAGDELVVAPGAYDALTARLVEQAGFPAVYMTGAGTSAGSASRTTAC